MAEFIFPYQVAYGDADAAGVVYYARYLEIMERARWAWLADLGIDVAQLHRDGVIFVVAEAHVRYRRAAPLGMVLAVGVRVKRLGRVAMTVIHEVRDRAGTLYVEGEVRLGCVDVAGRVQPLPDRVAAALAAKAPAGSPRGPL
ncbi:MAG: thioesterase family protein [Nitrospirota bacterium]|jgi:acyl-CoA thioester hydrolase